MSNFNFILNIHRTNIYDGHTHTHNLNDSESRKTNRYTNTQSHRQNEILNKKIPRLERDFICWHIDTKCFLRGDWKKKIRDSNASRQARCSPLIRSLNQWFPRFFFISFYLKARFPTLKTIPTPLIDNGNFSFHLI